ncbi:hypothetical protein [Humitalea rosea]|uniref:hypothetical protein n=1 Tax=Humitalea rosea TaxID=990373 RepID=UPI001314448C|nr:hypothetical protein [Humitalea rosea]
MDIPMNSESIEATKLGFSFAKDFSVQLITISTAIVVLSVTIAKDVVKKHSKSDFIIFLFIIIGSFLSILSGIICLMTLTGNLIPAEGPSNFVITSGTRFWAGTQVFLFLFVVFFFGLYGVKGAFRFLRNAP